MNSCSSLNLMRINLGDMSRINAANCFDSVASVLKLRCILLTSTSKNASDKGSSVPTFKITLVHGTSNTLRYKMLTIPSSSTIFIFLRREF
uniref:Secreted protein n=1 Tax=Ascaris lumbricoides TaxID=6252 RepID=A0A0M3HLW8_ASCLU